MSLRLDKIDNTFVRRLALIVCTPYGVVRHFIHSMKMFYTGLKADFMAVWKGNK